MNYFFVKPLTKKIVYSNNKKKSFSNLNFSMKTSILTVLALVLFSNFAKSQISTYRLLDYANLKSRITGNSSQSCIKMYDIAVDQKRGYAYTTPILTEYIAQININTKSHTGSVTYPYSSNISYVYVNPVNGYIICGDVEASPPTAYLIDPANSQVKGTFTYNGTQAGIAFDTVRNRILIGESTKIKILSGATLSVLDSFNVGWTVGTILLDSVCSKIYVSSKSLVMGNPQIRVFNALTPYAVLRTLSIPVSTSCGLIAADTGRNRFVLVNPDTLITANMSTGSVTLIKKLGSDVSGFEYDRRTGKGYFMNSTGYDQQGQGGTWAKMYVADFNTGGLDSFKRGDKSYKALLYESGNKLVWPDMHSGYVEILNLANNVIDSVHIGVTLDEMDISPDRNNIFIASRLGGSDVIKYDVNTLSQTRLKAGSWPCVVKTDSSLNKVFVLNHLQSTISVINPNTNSVTATINLPLNEGRGDAIAVMCYDKFLQKLFVCFPEFANIVKINAVTNGVESTTPIPGYTFNTNSGGIGLLQLITAPDFNKLFCFNKGNRKCLVFNTTTMAADSFSVNAQWNDTITSFEENCLYYDSVSNRLFIGNIIINAGNNSVAGKVSGFGRVVGINYSNSRMYGMIVSNDSLRMSEHSNTLPYNRTSIKVLYKKRKTGPIFFYDRIRNDFFVTELQYGILRHYDLDSTVNFITNISPAAEIPKQYSLSQNYPNPFNPTTRISFTIPDKSFVKLDVYDMTGKLIQELANSDMAGGDYTFEFNSAGLSSGIYFYRMQAGDFIETKRMVLVK